MPRRPHPTDPRAGFSLIEALIVLIVGAMALTLVFAVGGKANETDFRLGRRALITADSRVATDSLRAMISGIVLAPTHPGTGAGADTGQRPFVGDAGGFLADALLDTATPCASAGPVSDLRVELVRTQTGMVLACRVGQGAPVALFDLGQRRAAFSYSIDGQIWSDRWAERDGGAPDRAMEPHERRLYVRLASDDGSLQITGRASSDRPELQPSRQPIGPAL